MDNNLNIHGIHHITAIASSAAVNLEFYRQVLGLRLVKKTVNFDDPSTYHLYYGDAKGSPGTLLTFFPWERSPGGQSGAGMVTTITFMIPRASLEYWQQRLERHGVATHKTKRFGDPVIHFTDPHGLTLELVGVHHPVSIAVWRDGPIPAEHAIMGLHSGTALLTALDPTQALLVELLGMKLLEKEHNRYRFKMTNNLSIGLFLDVVVEPKAGSGRQGAGSVHHIAFRAQNSAEQMDWRRLLIENNLSVTPVRDRNYFTSIYFHEPGGILFEIATDPPGFSADESLESLGTELKLPKQYEPERALIESQLPKLESIHRKNRNRHRRAG